MLCHMCKSIYYSRYTDPFEFQISCSQRNFQLPQVVLLNAYYWCSHVLIIYIKMGKLEEKQDEWDLLWDSVFIKKLFSKKYLLNGTLN